MLILLSSGARPRYREDIVRALALPPGGHLQFRYDLSIVDQEVLRDARSGKLVGQRALVAYIWNRTEGAPVEVVPCRAAEITSAQIVGSSFVVIFKALEYPKLPSPAMAFLENMEAADRAKLPRWTLGDESKLGGLFAFPTERDPVSSYTDDLEAFEAIVRTLCGHSDFTDRQQYFYVSLGVSMVTVNPWGTEALTPISMSASGSYELTSGKEYELSLYVFAPEQSPTAAIAETAIHIASENKRIEFPRSTTREIDSEYDIKRFRFLTERSVFGVGASLIVFVHQKHEISEGSCDITIPVAFAGRWEQGALRTGLLAVGAAAPAMLAASTSGKLDVPLAFLMLGTALATGVATVFFSSK